MVELHNAKKYCVGSGLALQPRTPLLTMGQKSCFRVLRTVVFEMHDAKEYCVGSGLALQPPTPLHTRCQKKCFWVPRMAVLETLNAKNVVWLLGWRSKHPYHCTP